MRELKYLAGYSEKVTGQVGVLISENRLGSFLLKKYPEVHDFRTDKALYGFAVAIKNAFLRKSQPLNNIQLLGELLFYPRSAFKKLSRWTCSPVPMERI